jgi:hypothetical protein
MGMEQRELNQLKAQQSEVANVAVEPISVQFLKVFGVHYGR